MDVFDAIRSRCSVREYLDTPIPKDLLEKIVDSGRLAPTARKEEPWEFIVVTGRQQLTALADLTDHGKFIKSAAAAIAVFCRDTRYYLEDGCAATENMLIAAAGLGIGSCWVAGDKKPYCESVSKLLNVPSGYKLVSMIALGYPAKRAAPAEKRLLGDVLHWQKI